MRSGSRPCGVCLQRGCALCSAGGVAGGAPGSVKSRCAPGRSRAQRQLVWWPLGEAKWRPGGQLGRGTADGSQAKCHWRPPGDAALRRARLDLQVWPVQVVRAGASEGLLAPLRCVWAGEGPGWRVWRAGSRRGRLGAAHTRRSVGSRVQGCVRAHTYSARRRGARRRRSAWLDQAACTALARAGSLAQCLLWCGGCSGVL